MFELVARSWEEATEGTNAFLREPIGYEARVCFRIQVWVRVRDSAIFEKVGCGCDGVR